jgi:mRNA-degrading endonuclease RelE of RelBE toxin-antitoxin system
MAEKIARYRFTKKFKKEYKALPEEIQKNFDKKLANFLTDPTYPSLRLKRIQGTKNIWEGSITMKYRSTFEIINDEVIFRMIGTHDILKS